MSKKSKIKYEKKDLIVNNPFYCLGCNHQYTEKPQDIGSIWLEEYCRYLGFCGIKCWDKLPHYLKHDIANKAMIHGSTAKVRHKFYLKNVKGYK